MKAIVCAAIALLLAIRGWASGMTLGSAVTLGSQVTAGVPVHEQKSDAAFVRWPNGTNAVVVQDDGKWLKVKAADKEGWVLEKYVELQDQPEAQSEEDGNEIPTVVVGSWNLEYFHDGKKRGFPEYQGQAALPPRTNVEYQRIADAIRDQLHAGVMVLNEISGLPDKTESDELARLCGMIGPKWKYILGKTGGIGATQRVALLYDEGQVALVQKWEIAVPKSVVNGADILDRDPLAGFFRTQVGNQQPGTDFVVVALHLASGQQNVANHNAAMEKVRQEIKTLLTSAPELKNETEILMAGDINADRYDTHVENFWGASTSSTTSSTDINYVTFSGLTRDEYMATRVVGNDPPEPRSYIDYIFGSQALANHVVFPIATVHHELATGGDFYRYRVNYSDHFPVTVAIKLTEDDDG